MAIKTSVMAPGEESCAEIRRVQETQQRKQRIFGGKDVPEENALFGSTWGAMRDGDPLRPVYAKIVGAGTQRSSEASSLTQ